MPILVTAGGALVVVVVMAIGFFVYVGHVLDRPGPDCDRVALVYELPSGSTVEGSPLTPNRLEIYVDDRDRVEDVTIIRRTP